jgi:hypothetical protein
MSTEIESNSQTSSDNYVLTYTITEEPFNVSPIASLESVPKISPVVSVDEEIPQSKCDPKQIDNDLMALELAMANLERAVMALSQEKTSRKSSDLDRKSADSNETESVPELEEEEEEEEGTPDSDKDDDSEEESKTEDSDNSDEDNSDNNEDSAEEQSEEHTEEHTDENPTDNEADKNTDSKPNSHVKYSLIGRILKFLRLIR